MSDTKYAAISCFFGFSHLFGLECSQPWMESLALLRDWAKQGHQIGTDHSRNKCTVHHSCYKWGWGLGRLGLARITSHKKVKKTNKQTNSTSQKPTNQTNPPKTK